MSSRTVAHDLIHQSSILTRILTFIGLWPLHTHKPCKRVLRLLIVNIPTTFLYTTLMWMDAFTSENVSHTAEVFYMALTETSLWVKIWTIWRYNELARNMLHEWQTEDLFALRTVQEHIMWQRAQKSFGIFLYSYIGISMCSVYSSFSSVLFKGYSELPISFWVPYDFQLPLNYWLTFAYEFVALPLTALSNMTLDLLFCYFFYHVALIYRLVGMRLENLGWEKPSSEHAIQKQLIQHIQLHQCVTK